MSEENRPPLNRDHPRIDAEEVPAYYSNDDVPHILALLRTFDRFFDEVVDRDKQFREHYAKLYDRYMTMMERELQPYAFDLAISLIALEDERAKEAPKE